METELNQVIVWLSGVGSLVVVQWGLSWALEGLAFWDNLASRIRLLVALALSAGVSIGATYLILNPEIIEPIKPYLSGLLLVIAGWVSQKVAHNKNPARAAGQWNCKEVVTGKGQSGWL